MTQTILCINGSDASGHSGIQSDIQTSVDLGVISKTVVTSVTIQNTGGIKHIYELPQELVTGQISSVYEDQSPCAVKIGMVNNPQTIHSISKEICTCKHIICSPGILASTGGCLMSTESIHSFVNYIIPLTELIILKCTDAAILLGESITCDDDMLRAARRLHELGAEWVMLRGGTFTAGRVNALLSGHGEERFFSSVNVDGWQQHGVGGALSTAVTARIALGDDIPGAIKNAHTYIHNKVVYAVKDKMAQRHAELYNQFLSLIADNYRTKHNVQFYASSLVIGTRYLSQITNNLVGKSPKQIIDEYVLDKIEHQLLSSNLTIQQIAYSMGFSSQVTFTKFFTSKKGIPPTTYRLFKTTAKVR